MISAKELYDYIDSFAPFESAMDFDNVGILVGDPDYTSRKVLLALDVTTAVIDEAVAKGCTIIVTHHPVIFHPLKSVLSDSLPYRLIQNGLTVLSAHTNLDICEGGVNDTLARTIGLELTERTDKDCFVTGELCEAVDFTNFAEKIQYVLGCKGFRFTGRNGLIKRVSVACGAGGGSIFRAVKEKADAFVTGEIKHHEWLAAREHNIAVYDLGHFRSEDMIIAALVQRLSAQFPDTVFEKAEADTEEILYYHA